MMQSAYSVRGGRDRSWHHEGRSDSLRGARDAAFPHDAENDWQTRYSWKVASAEEAIRAIPPGRRILIGSGAAEPGRLVEAMVEHGTHLFGNEIVHLLTLGPAPYVAPGLQERFRHTAFFIGANVRQAVQEGRADFMPVFLSEIPQVISSGRVAVDVALIQVSQPDRHGFVSLGVSVDIVRAAVDSASLILAEVNPRMPRTHGDSFIHVERIAHLVPVDYALLELPTEPLDDVCRQIGLHAAGPDRRRRDAADGHRPDSRTPSSPASETGATSASTPRCSPTASCGSRRRASSPGRERRSCRGRW